jgi:hypothetical protein
MQTGDINAISTKVAKHQGYSRNCGKLDQCIEGASRQDSVDFSSTASTSGDPEA